MDRPSSGELVATHIRRAVTTGAYRPGERVRQDEIAAELGVSRIPVREALVALEREGWVTVEPHRGAYVTGLDVDFVRDHFEVHGAIVALMATRAMERADADTLQHLLDAAAAVVDAPDDPAVFNRLTYVYVDALERAAAAPRLTSMTRVTANLYPGNFFAEVPGAMEREREGVAAIADAIIAGDATRAANECDRMTRDLGEVLIRVLQSRGVFDAPDGAAAVTTG
jgi:DNA-binding GntR family transcriptional regulator